MKGKLIIFSAPSGAGKTTIVHRVIESRNDLEFSVSACSRKIRGNEKNGVDYYFISADEFREKIKNNEFLEWQEVYENSFYGTLKSEMVRIWNDGKNVIFDVDVKGGLNIKNYGKEDALAIFVMPPSMQELESRLRKRLTETEETLKKRLDKAAYEITFANQFDVIIINDDLEKAVDKAKAEIRKFLS